MDSRAASAKFNDDLSALLAYCRPTQRPIVVKALSRAAETRRSWHEDIEDLLQLAQEKLCKALRQADKWRARWPLKAVATRCAKDVAADWHRSDRTRSDQVRQTGDQAFVAPPAVPRGGIDELALLDKGVGLARSAGASATEALIWTWACALDVSPEELGKAFSLKSNAIYQAIHRVRHKVFEHLSRELALTDHEAAVLENERRPRKRRTPEQLAEELGRSGEEIERMIRDLRARVADYVDRLEGSG